ncbi:MAG TPA: SpoIIE family protein phosphatase [Stenomitos sp.]
MYSILIIDDDPVTKLMLRRILEQQGYSVETAQDGQEGIAKAAQIMPALIICDWLMPITDGLEVCRFVKKHEQLCTTFFVLLTSRVELEDRIEGLNAGADEFLAKPIDMNELTARVRAGLRLYQLNQDLQQQKQVLENELAEAASYVRSILPEPMRSPLKIESLFLPSRQLGGDSFDYFWLDADTLVLYLLDVAGHGLGAALPSVSILNLLRSQSLSGVNYTEPAEVLTALNRGFQMSNHSNKYFSIWYGVYHCSTRHLRFASAGHPPAMLWSPANQCTMLKTPGFPIGLFPDEQYATAHCSIDSDSTLYLYSDGVYEVYQEPGVIWGLNAFQALLQTTPKHHHWNLEELIQQIQDNAGTQSFLDDFSLIKVRFFEAKTADFATSAH